jgi:hypothetical protein
MKVLGFRWILIYLDFCRSQYEPLKVLTIVLVHTKAPIETIQQTCI